jgi:hypothetical protein
MQPSPPSVHRLWIHDIVPPILLLCSIYLLENVNMERENGEWRERAHMPESLYARKMYWHLSVE